MPVQQSNIGSWSQEVLVKFIRDILENQPVTSFQSLKVDDLEVVRRLLLDDELVVAKDARLHEIGRPGEPEFDNSWVNYDATTSPAGYWKDALGVVHIQGLIKSGTVGDAAFTLPPGYRPAFQHPFGTVSNGAIGRVDVFGDGTVVPAAPSNNTWVALDGITFIAVPAA